jgi:hypothetical protein
MGERNTSAIAPLSQEALLRVAQPRKRHECGDHLTWSKRTRHETAEGKRANERAASHKEAEFQRFRTWLRDTGFCWNDKELDLRASGTISAGGVFAKRNIPIDKTAVRIPKSGCITWRTSSLAQAIEKADAQAATAGAKARGANFNGTTKGTATRGAGAGLLPSVPANVKLILCLIHEIDLGSQSPWAPYLLTIPEVRSKELCVLHL